MLDLEKLFKIRPFVFFVREEYFAFGSGVCKRCNNEHGNPVTLPLRYERYLAALKQEGIAQSDAWDVYRKVNSVAENIQSLDDHLHLPEKFEKLNFSDSEKESIQKQLEQVVSFFRDNRLGDYYRN